METAVERYLRRKAELARPEAFRENCARCRKPRVTCYCSTLSPVATTPRVVVLMHPLEAKHPVGTGRMTHQCLSNSSLFLGVDFSAHAEINGILRDPKLFPIILYPGPRSVDLSALVPGARRDFLPEGREPVVFVLDGTWNLAKKLLTRSPNLQSLPRVCFTPSRPSRFLVRKQPKPHCYSTIEAIHELLTLLEPVPQAADAPRTHDVLLEAFDQMVQKQLSFRKPGPTRHTRNYRARLAKKLASVNALSPS